MYHDSQLLGVVVITAFHHNINIDKEKVSEQMNVSIHTKVIKYCYPFKKNYFIILMYQLLFGKILSCTQVGFQPSKNILMPN